MTLVILAKIAALARPATFVTIQLYAQIFKVLENNYPVPKLLPKVV